jgi:hypothetical protein
VLEVNTHYIFLYSSGLKLFRSDKCLASYSREALEKHKNFHVKCPWLFSDLTKTAARQDTFLQAAANFLRDPQSPRVIPSALHVALKLDVDPVPLLHCSRRFHSGLFRRDLPMFRFGYHVLRIWLLALRTCLRLSKTGSYWGQHFSFLGPVV